MKEIRQGHDTPITIAPEMYGKQVRVMRQRLGHFDHVLGAEYEAYCAERDLSHPDPTGRVDCEPCSGRGCVTCEGRGYARL